MCWIRKRKRIEDGRHIIILGIIHLGSLIPTKEEALAMADNAYDPENGNNGLIGGWIRSNAVGGINYNDKNTGLNSALYERVKKDGQKEYVYATGGTNDLKDLVADGLQLIGKSGQYEESVFNAKTISESLEGNEVTFVGHSLGGGEAAANALATGRSAITFNAAGLSNATKTSLGLHAKAADITNYEVVGQIIAPQSLIGGKPQGSQEYINTSSWVPLVLPLGGLYESLDRHLINRIKKEIK